MRHTVKRTLAMFLAILMLASTTVMAVDYGAEVNPTEKTYQQTFSDVPTNHWAFKFIGELVERKAIAGYPDGKFYPDNTVTRQEFAKIMVVAAGLTATRVEISSYADVPATNWASPFIEAASDYMTAYRNAATGVMNFKPKAGALREDIAVAVVKLRGYDTRLADLSLLTTMFSDVDSISEVAKPYVALAVENKIISGYTDGTFRAQATIARSEAAAILWRAFQYGNDEKVVSDKTPKPVVTPKPSPKPSASPKPSPKPTPTPEPTPTPVPEKPYLADTVVSANIDSTKYRMTMDDNSRLIYYDVGQKAILRLDHDTAATETLLDVAAATYTVTTEAVGETPATSVTYKDLAIEQVFWDKVGQRLLVAGEFKAVQTGGGEAGWEDADGSGSKTYRAIFTLADGTLTFFANIPESFGESYSTYRYNHIQCALDDGKFVIGYYNSGINSCIYNFGTTQRVTNLRISNRNVVQNGRDLYAIYYGTLFKYDYGADQWTTVCTTNKGADTYQNDMFYIWNSTEIRATKPNGQKKTMLNPSTDVDVLDLLRLPGSPSNLFVTKDGRYLFYDDAGKAIRMISPNPEY